MAAALVDAANTCNVATLNKTETLHMWAFIVSIFFQMSERNGRNLTDELPLADGIRLYVIVRGRQPLCHGC